MKSSTPDAGSGIDIKKIAAAVTLERRPQPFDNVVWNNTSKPLFSTRGL